MYQKLQRPDEAGAVSATCRYTAPQPTFRCMADSVILSLCTTTFLFPASAQQRSKALNASSRLVYGSEVLTG